VYFNIAYEPGHALTNTPGLAMIGQQGIQIDIIGTHGPTGHNMGTLGKCRHKQILTVVDCVLFVCCFVTLKQKKKGQKKSNNYQQKSQQLIGHGCYSRNPAGNQD
jgi:hypothetical protein